MAARPDLRGGFLVAGVTVLIGATSLLAFLGAGLAVSIRDAEEYLGQPEEVNRSASGMAQESYVEAGALLGASVVILILAAIACAVLIRKSRIPAWLSAVLSIAMISLMLAVHALFAYWL
ncbi:hypothetical protein C5B99_17390 [Pseudoclavibacter sp. Z016]|nr:hypothetical protein C5B99_17390 [Pseudoclavibacter sp. Z016]